MPHNRVRGFEKDFNERGHLVEYWPGRRVTCSFLRSLRISQILENMESTAGIIQEKPVSLRLPGFGQGGRFSVTAFDRRRLDLPENILQ